MKVQSNCDYILHGRRLQWQNFKVIGTDFVTPHRLIKGKLITFLKSKKHETHMKKRKDHGVDLFGNMTKPESESDELLKEVHESIEKNVLNQQKSSHGHPMKHLA